MTHGMCSYGHLKISKTHRLKFETVICLTNISDVCHFASISGSLPAPRGLDSSHRGFFVRQKTRPWIFGACILWSLSFFVDFRVPPSTPWSMSLPQALFFSQKTHPWIFGTCILWILSISGELGGHQGWGNLLSGLGEPAGRMRGNLPGRPVPTAL